MGIGGKAIELCRMQDDLPHAEVDGVTAVIHGDACEETLTFLRASYDHLTHLQYDSALHYFSTIIVRRVLSYLLGRVAHLPR
jgi:hypothetical protein